MSNPPRRARTQPPEAETLRERPGRDQQISTERRRRKSADGIQKRLFVDESKLDFFKFAYRWITNDPARVVAKTKYDDWDVVPEDEIAGPNEHIVAAPQEGGQALKHILVRKPREFYEDDQREKDQKLDRQMDSIKAGAAPSDGEGAATNTYKPNVENNFTAAQARFEP